MQMKQTFVVCALGLALISVCSDGATAAGYWDRAGVVPCAILPEFDEFYFTPGDTGTVYHDDIFVDEELTWTWVPDNNDVPGAQNIVGQFTCTSGNLYANAGGLQGGIGAFDGYGAIHSGNRYVTSPFYAYVESNQQGLQQSPFGGVNEAIVDEAPWQVNGVNRIYSATGEVFASGSHRFWDEWGNPDLAVSVILPELTLTFDSLDLEDQ
jgi:hypothetical protein